MHMVRCNIGIANSSGQGLFSLNTSKGVQLALVLLIFFGGADRTGARIFDSENTIKYGLAMCMKKMIAIHRLNNAFLEKYLHYPIPFRTSSAH